MGPSSTHGRNGNTTAASNNPPCRSSAAASCNSKRGWSQRSNTFSSATSEAPWLRSTPCFNVDACKPANDVPQCTTNPARRSWRLADAEASVATTASNNGARARVTCPTPAPTSTRTPPSFPKRSLLCEVVRTDMAPRPTMAFASVRLIPYFRSQVHAMSRSHTEHFGAMKDSCKKASVSASRPSSIHAATSSFGKAAIFTLYCSSSTGKRTPQWAHETALGLLRHATFGMPPSR
mmetsp:Transcript_79557/g.221361  ORF Transcript_79557/g.221361 Transcript_79557/m.221361 type:complete len:235 (+) Transcript_79557:372-1076(+)